MVLQPDDRRAEHADAVRLKPADQGRGVDPVKLGIAAVLALQTQPDPRKPKPHELLDAIGSQGTLAELKTYSDHTLSCFSIRSSSRRARLRSSRKFSSIMKNDCTFMFVSSCDMISNSSSPVS